MICVIADGQTLSEVLARRLAPGSDFASFECSDIFAVQGIATRLARTGKPGRVNTSRPAFEV
jgi:hypothetical protein